MLLLLVFNYGHFPALLSYSQRLLERRAGFVSSIPLVLVAAHQRCCLYLRLSACHLPANGCAHRGSLVSYAMLQEYGVIFDMGADAGYHRNQRWWGGGLYLNGSVVLWFLLTGLPASCLVSVGDWYPCPWYKVRLRRSIALSLLFHSGGCRPLLPGLRLGRAPAIHSTEIVPAPTMHEQVRPGCGLRRFLPLA